MPTMRRLWCASDASKDAEGVAMKQARRWLLLAAALVLVPQHALRAEEEPPKAGGATTAAAPAGAAGGGGSRGHGCRRSTSTIRRRASRQPPAAAIRRGTPPAGGAPAVASARSTPDAPRPKAAKDIGLEAGEEGIQSRDLRGAADLRAQGAALRDQAVLRGFTLNDQFVSHDGPGLALNYLHHERARGRRQRQLVLGRSTATRTSTSRIAARRASRCR